MPKDISWYKDNLPKMMLVLGVLGLVFSILAPNPSATWLFSFISVVPILMFLITQARLKNVEAQSQMEGRVIIEASWIALNMGLSYIVMAPSAYYSAGSVLSQVGLILVGLALLVLGLASIVTFGKAGHILTP